MSGKEEKVSQINYLSCAKKINEKMENPIQFTKEQLKYAINEHIKQGEGVQELLGMVLNSVMKCERDVYLSDSKSGNKGNGYRLVKNSSLGNGVHFRIPRDRLGHFQPMVMELIHNQTEKIHNLAFHLYGSGLSTRQIERILSEMYGSGYSKSSISRIRDEYNELLSSWLHKSLDSYYPVIYIDATHVKVRRDTVSSEAFYVILGLKEDHTREILGVVNYPTESSSNWEDVLEDLKSRGLENVGLIVSDDLSGLTESVSKHFPEASQQKCILHFQRNLNKKIRVSDRKPFSQELKQLFNPDQEGLSKKEAVEALKSFIGKWDSKYPKLAKLTLNPNIELLFTYLDYDKDIRRMIYTTNWIERLNKSFKRTLKNRNALPSIDAAMKLFAYTGIEIENNTYSYPLYIFKNENKLVQY